MWLFFDMMMRFKVPSLCFVLQGGGNSSSYDSIAEREEGDLRQRQRWHICDLKPRSHRISKPIPS